MLEELEVRDLGPIAHADVVPSAGMTAITGETGAGKSMLLSALGLIRGGQSDAGRVSPGAKSAWAQGIFDVAPGSAAEAIAAQAGAPAQDGQVFLTREVPSQGRSRAVLDGRTVPRGLLREVSDELITIHGQADQLRLVSPSRQRAFLDQYAGDGEQVRAYQSAWRAYAERERRLQELEGQRTEARQRADYLREAIAQIERVDPQPHEDEDLREQRTRLEHAEEIQRAVLTAIMALDPSGADASADGESPASAMEGLVHAQEALRQASGSLSSLGRIADQLDSLSSQLSDVVSQLSGLLESGGEESMSLDDINSRIHDLSVLTRRWGPGIDEVLAWKEKAQAELDSMDSSPERLARLASERDQAREKALEAGRALQEVRKGAGERLAREVNRELGSLAMAGARLTVRVQTHRSSPSARERRTGPRDADTVRNPAVSTRSGSGQALSGAPSSGPVLGPSGIDDVSFLFAAFPGAPNRPLGKSTSGGELSRLMLAMELALARSLRDGRVGEGAESRQGGSRSSSATDSASAESPDPSRLTFVFDEVDAGVGGETALELGRRLARLARSSQVIVVTHLAQVASWAQTQYVVSKGEKEGSGTVTATVRQVRGQDRVHEIARMLSGGFSRVSLEHASQLLASCRPDGAPGTGDPQGSHAGRHDTEGGEEGGADGSGKARRGDGPSSRDGRAEGHRCDGRLTEGGHAAGRPHTREGGRNGRR